MRDFPHYTELMGLALNRVDLRKNFNHLFTSRELGIPNLEFFTKMLGDLNLKPEECIMVGNDCEMDIIPAKAVGLHTILFTEENNKAIFNYADYLISSMIK
ncbi:HAD family hydrolase [Lederbergia citrea]|uniref:HAD family hydrolase n=1 Tax=Lederbergia citrea TaxID=2833581 RepID=UPI001BC9A631|nr:HAD hydrolase-like protein [Lederbergia citrea]MBS4203625.1 HAD hydrolase-like protein [Lederbergia citrea]